MLYLPNLVNKLSKLVKPYTKLGRYNISYECILYMVRKLTNGAIQSCVQFPFLDTLLAALAQTPYV